MQFNYDAQITVLFTKEDDSIVAYAPALNLGSCGRNREEATRRLGNAIKLFFTELLEMGTVDKALRELGWRPAEENRFVVPRISQQPARIQRSIPSHLLGRRSMNIQVPVAA